jgi:hypothetical protein
MHSRPRTTLNAGWQQALPTSESSKEGGPGTPAAAELKAALPARPTTSTQQLPKSDLDGLALMLSNEPEPADAAPARTASTVAERVSHGRSKAEPEEPAEYDHVSRAVHQSLAVQQGLVVFLVLLIVCTMIIKHPFRRLVMAKPRLVASAE